MYIPSNKHADPSYLGVFHIKSVSTSGRWLRNSPQNTDSDVSNIYWLKSWS